MAKGELNFEVNIDTSELNKALKNTKVTIKKITTKISWWQRIFKKFRTLLFIKN